ncbi:hypothetical protein PF003_g30612 [Phytophthora fragariae]|nr:hypothetical protein PF003_g30612 [Phytophthora fragariae]
MRDTLWHDRMKLPGRVPGPTESGCVPPGHLATPVD